MKTLKVEYFEDLNYLTINEVAHFFQNRMSWNYINIVNWSDDFPYKPDCKFKIARSNSKLFIRFEVNEKNLLATFTGDNDPVWQDSCVEFFCRLPGHTSYFNFEFNCIGTCLASKRDGRELNIVPFTQEQLADVERHSSLPFKTFTEQKGNFDWNLTIAIPLKLIEAEKASCLHANFYKCGDKTSDPHYLSWNNIDTENPNFHCPEFFGELSF